MKLTGVLILQQLIFQSMHSHCQFRFCLLARLSASHRPERLVRVFKTLTKLNKTVEIQAAFQLKVIFWADSQMQSSRCSYPPLNLPGSWSPYQLLHVVLAVVVIQKVPGSKGRMSSERLIPAPAAPHGGLSDLVYRLGAGVSSVLKPIKCCKTMNT